MSVDRSDARGETQGKRRVKYGLNVAVAVAAVIAIVVLVNWIGYRRFVRLDLTATRRYSLSPQTVKLITGLDDGYRCVTLFSQASPYADQARDLLDEYQRYGRGLAVEHIDPGRELGRLEKFLMQLRRRFAGRLEPIERATDRGRDALDQIRQEASGLLTPLQSVLKDPALGEDDFRAFVGSVAQAFARFDSDIDTVGKQITRSLDGPLPRYGQAKSTVETLLRDLDAKVFTLAIDRFRTAGDADDTPASVANQLLALTGELERIRENIRDATSALRDVQLVEDYDKLVRQLDSPDTVVLVGPEQVRVIGLGEMFREPDTSQVGPGQQPELRFQGEEKITGALVSMSLDHQPMVVFVTTGPMQALGSRGLFEHVAQRLRNINFDVQQWNPQGQPGSMGQMMPAGPPPQPQPDQKAVWVVLPISPPNPMNPTAIGSGQQVGDLLQKRLDVGDSAIVMLTVSPMAQFAGPDPVAQLLSPWGITPQLDRVVMRQLILPNHQTRAVTQLEISSWPDDLVITRAMAGMPGIFLQASPLVLGGGDDGAQTWPLVEVSGRDMWTHRDIQTQQNPKLDPATAGGPFVIAAAAQRQDKRLVVVADPAWASDQITLYGRQGLPAEIVGAAFPANAELFVNSVYWLAGLDQLIAASPRTQDIRRIGPITWSGLVVLRWGLLLGMPAVVGVVGVSVWMARRRS